MGIIAETLMMMTSSSDRVTVGGALEDAAAVARARRATIGALTALEDAVGGTSAKIGAVEGPVAQLFSTRAMRWHRRPPSFEWRTGRLCPWRFQEEGTSL